MFQAADGTITPASGGWFRINARFGDSSAKLPEGGAQRRAFAGEGWKARRDVPGFSVKQPRGLCNRHGWPAGVNLIILLACIGGNPLNGTSIEVRQLVPGEAAIASRFIAALLEELSGGEAVQSDQLLPVAEEVLRTGSVAGFVAATAGRQVGLLMLNECAAVYAGGRFGEITELYVEPDWRSKGVAAALVAAASEHGRQHGWKRLEVGAPDQPAWARTLAFYKRSGFQEVGPRLRCLL